MLTVFLAASLLLAPAFDGSKAYFPGLTRPPAKAMKMSRPADGPVILIVVDALRPDRMSTYGFGRTTTPNLDALADEGVVFTQFFTNGNWTRPSTASLLTGMLPHRHGVERDADRLPGRFQTLPEALKRRGFRTSAVIGNGNAGSAFGLDRGFDTYADTRRHWDGLPSADQVIDLAVPYVRENRDHPFFLMLFLIDPHDPYHAPGEFETMFVEDTSVPLIRTPHWELGRYSKAQRNRMMAVYDGAVRYTDSALGRFFRELKSAGLYDKSTIVVTSDHGEAFGEHGVYLHAHHLYDELIRAPLIVRAPSMSQRGVYSPLLSQTVDLFPSLLAHTGGSVPAEVQGIDLFAQLAAPNSWDPNRLVVAEFSNFGIRRRTLRGYRHKVIAQFAADEDVFAATVGKKSLLPSVIFRDEQWQFFRVDRDPKEQKDLYSKKRAEDKQWQRMIKILRAQESSRIRRDPAVVERLDEETRRDLKSLGYIQ